MRSNATSLVLMLGLAPLLPSGCTKRFAQHAEVADAAPPEPKTSVVVLGDEREIIGGTFASNGDVVAMTPSGLFRFAPQSDAPATVIPLAPPDTLRSVTAARAADVVVATTLGALYVSRAGGALEKVVDAPKGLGVWDPILSPDGRLVAASVGATYALYDVASKKLLASLAYGSTGPKSFFSPDGRWVLHFTGAILSPDPSVPVLPPPADTVALGWAGGEAILADKREVFLLDPSTHAKTRLPQCDGPATYDEVGARVVFQCARQIDVVAVPSGARVTIPVTPPPFPVAAKSLRFTRDRALLARYEAWDRPQLTRVLRIDPVAKTVTPVGGEVEESGPRGEPEGTSKLCEGCGSSPDGSRWLTRDPLTVVDVNGRAQASWPSLGQSGYAAFRDRGFDLFTHFGAKAPHVRIGPPAASPYAEAVVPNERRARGACREGRLHATLTNGELWISNSDEPRFRSCVCDKGECHDAPAPSHLSVVAGKGNTLVFAGGGEGDTQIHVADAAGKVRGVVMTKGRCRRARIRDDESVVALVCPDRVVEIDLAKAVTVRETLLPIERGERDLEAVGAKAFVVKATRSDGFLLSRRVVEAGTGKTLASVHAGEAGAAVTFPDGAVEIFGDEAAVTRTLRCAEGDKLLPFAHCRDRLVKGRFAVDL